MTNRPRGRRIAMHAALVVAIAACSPGSAAVASPPPTAVASATAASSVPSPLATPYPAHTATSSPSLAFLPDGGKFESRTYATHFDPAFSVTLPGAGDSNIDIPCSVDLSFEGDPGLSWNVGWLDQVYDPEHANSLIDAPHDLPAWFVKVPGLTRIAAAKTVQVGGLDATQLDFRNTRPVRFGPFSCDDPTGSDLPQYRGFGEKGNTFRLVVLRAGGHNLVFTMWVDLCCSSPNTASTQFASSMATLQPVMDSIVWAPRP